MSEQRYLQLLWLITAGILAVGIVMTVKTHRELAQNMTLFESKINDYEALKKLESRVVGYNKAVSMYEDLGEVQLAPLKDLLKKRFPDVNDDDIREVRREAMSGWRVREAEVALNDVLLSSAMSFTSDIEKGRPPWVLTKCVLTASSGIEGKGNAVLSFAGVSR